MCNSSKLLLELHINYIKTRFMSRVSLVKSTWVNDQQHFKQLRPHRVQLPRFSINIKTPEQIKRSLDKGVY